MMNNQNLNSLVSRMFANAKQEAASNDNAPATSIKRNLFGIRLNHDQLKQDLNEMWQEQLDRKKREWNFDFETLKPIETTETNSKRYDWNKVKTQATIKQDDLVLTTFNSNELFNSDDEQSDEEDDDALAVPAFYKYQRRQKMNSGFKFIQIEAATPEPVQTTKQTAFSKLKQSGSTKKCALHRPKPVKQQTPAKQQQRQSNLIITFSENRKDTLRSAVSSSSSKTMKREAKSAFKQPETENGMKQQSLLDMLKQRKRKTSNLVCSKATSENVAQSSISSANSIVHNLRPRTISFN